MITFQTPPFLFPCPLKSRAQNDRWVQRALFLSELQTCSWSFRGCDQNRCGTAAKKTNCELNIEMLINKVQVVVKRWRQTVVKYSISFLRYKARNKERPFTSPGKITSLCYGQKSLYSAEFGLCGIKWLEHFVSWVSMGAAFHTQLA